MEGSGEDPGRDLALIWDGSGEDLGWIWRGYCDESGVDIGWISDGYRMDDHTKVAQDLARFAKKCKKNAKKCTKVLHISKKSSIFASDLGIVPDRTIKYYRVMKKECVFRIEVEGWLWRVEAAPFVSSDTPRVYRIMHRRKCYARFPDVNAQDAIRLCMQFALGCRVDIKWGTQA